MLDIAEMFGVGRSTVQEWFQITGAFRVRKRNLTRIRKGQNHPSWLGTSVSYRGVHKRLDRLYGQPKKCDICGTITASRYEWANLTGNYDDINDYKRMCKKCHSAYDKNYGAMLRARYKKRFGEGNNV